MAILLTSSFIIGQLIKLPIGNSGGITILDLVFLLFCLVSIIKNKFLIPKLPGFIRYGLFFAFCGLVSLILSPLPLNPFEEFISFSYLLRFLLFLTAGLFFYHNFFQVKKNTEKILIFAGIGLSLAGILQIIFIPDLLFLTTQGWDPHYYRLATTFLDPNFAGSYFVLTLILTFLNPLRLSQKTQLGIFGLVFLSLLLTFSRGSYLMFFIGFSIISIFQKSLKTLIFTIILSLVLGCSFLIYQQLIAVPKGVDRTESAQQRLGTWQQGWEIFTKNPILGVGFNSYRPALKYYSLADQQQISSHGGSTNDSSFLFVASTTGLVGLVAYSAFLFSIFKTSLKSWSAKNVWGLVVISSLAGLIAQSFFANTLFYPPLLGWLMLSLSQVSKSNSR